MKWIGLLVALAACKHGSAGAGPSITGDEPRAELAPDDEPPPPYDQAALGKALSDERAAEARAERELAEAEAGGDEARLREAIANLAVRRRFIATLEICEAQSRLCPPRLDDPPWPYAVDSEEDPKLDTPLRFDAGTWPKVAAELHGRACACRTLSCIDSMDATIARLETRPIEDVQKDEAAGESITRARECLMRLRGKRPLPKLATSP